MDDPFDLQRFVDAQAPVVEQIRGELRRGRKTSHWMWFIFPQLAGLGRSETARFFAIGSLDEARAYLAHPVLGPRLRQCVELVNAVQGRSAVQIFGPVDAQKLQSSMTLFREAAPEEAIFDQALARFFAGEADEASLRLLAGAR